MMKNSCITFHCNHLKPRPWQCDEVNICTCNYSIVRKWGIMAGWTQMWQSWKVFWGLRLHIALMSWDVGILEALNCKLVKTLIYTFIEKPVHGLHMLIVCYYYYSWHKLNGEMLKDLDDIHQLVSHLVILSSTL